jgi:hypothetical protein
MSKKGPGTKPPRHYHRWQSMKQRCLNPNNPYFKYYGGRGIKIAEEWLDFYTFFSWCERTYQAGKTLDRLDNDGPYAPDNCGWSTPREQQANARIGLRATNSVKAMIKARMANRLKVENGRH